MRWDNISLGSTQEAKSGIMNSTERIIAALERRQPDRLPTFEWKISQHVIEAFAPGGNLFDFVEAAGHDAVCCSPVYRRIEQLDKKSFIDEFQVTRRLTDHDRYPVSIGHPITDLASFRRYEPPPLDSPERFRDIDAAIQRFGKKKAVVAVLNDVFSLPRDLIGFEQFLSDFLLNTKLVREVVQFSVDYNLELARLVSKRGVRIIGICDDLADSRGPMISPALFREILYPEFKRVVQGYKRLGFYVIKHSDGNLRPILDMILDSGIDCLDPIDPLGGMDIGHVREAYGNRIARKGNVDCVRSLVDGTVEEVEQETLECIRKGSPGGGHIISSSNSIHAGVCPELYRIMLRMIEQHGDYPIRPR